jgi:hypothetical protein
VRPSMAQRRHVFRRVVGLVFAHGDATTGRLPPGPQHRFRGPAFGRAIGLRHPAGDRQPVPVLHAGVAHKESFVSRPAAFRYSRLSGSVTLAWVSFLRCWPRKLVPSVSSLPSLGQARGRLLGRKLFCGAHASISVPSTEKCSSESSSAKAVTGVTPDRVTTDGHDAYPRAIRMELGKPVRHRINRSLNNRLEQDHRGIKGRCRPMLRFKSIPSAR